MKEGDGDVGPCELVLKSVEGGHEPDQAQRNRMQSV